MRRDDRVYLRHILEAIEKIDFYLGEASEEAFLKNSLVQDGIIRQIEIIGEATRHLSLALRSAHHHIAWTDIAGMRDKLILSIKWDKGVVTPHGTNRRHEEWFGMLKESDSRLVLVGGYWELGVTI